MQYDVEDIVKEVRIALDENSQSTALLAISDNDTLELNDIIYQKIIHAIRMVVGKAPSHLLDEGKDFSSSTLTWESGVVGKGMAWIKLPDDFLRLVIFRMTDWQRPVLTPISDTDDMYYLQKSRFAGVRGGVEKPVCAITTYPEGKVMECYSSKGGADVKIKVAKYISEPKIEEGKVYVCDKLFTPVVYTAAALTAMTFKDANADPLLKIANEYLTEYE